MPMAPEFGGQAPLGKSGVHCITRCPSLVWRLVPLVDYLAAWKLLPSVSRLLLHTVERGYRIQFGAPPPTFNRLIPMLVGPEQVLVMEQEVNTLLRKEAIEVIPPLERLPGSTAGTSSFPRRMEGCVLF